jgi:serine/threonine protein kinase
LLTSCSSAKDQLTQQPVAVKKIMKPFSTPVLSKRTYRELKLLKHLRHENVSGRATRRNKSKKPLTRTNRLSL